MNEKEFELETVLTIINGVNYTKDFNKVFELAKFVYNDGFINSTALILFTDELKEHLLGCIEKEVLEKGFILEENQTIENWLNDSLKYNPAFRINEELWLESLKIKLGNTIKVERINKVYKEEMPTEETKKEKITLSQKVLKRIKKIN